MKTYNNHPTQLKIKESNVQDSLQSAVMELLTYVLKKYKCHFYHPCEEKWSKNKGMPDIIGHVVSDWYDGEDTLLFYIELKTRSNKPTLHQLAYMQRLDESGYQGAVCYSVEDVRDFLQNVGFSIDRARTD